MVLPCLAFNSKILRLGRVLFFAVSGLHAQSFPVHMWSGVWGPVLLKMLSLCSRWPHSTASKAVTIGHYSQQACTNMTYKMHIIYSAGQVDCAWTVAKDPRQFQKSPRCAASQAEVVAAVESRCAIHSNQSAWPVIRSPLKGQTSTILYKWQPFPTSTWGQTADERYNGSENEALLKAGLIWGGICCSHTYI